MNTTRLAAALAAAAALGVSLTGCSLPFTGGGSQNSAISGSGLGSKAQEILAHDVGHWDAKLMPGTITVGGGDARAAVRSVSADGGTLVIDPSADGAGAIAAGKILFLPRVGISRVDSVSVGAAGLVVATRPARLQDAIQRGGFDFDAPVDLSAAVPVTIDDGTDCPGQNGVSHAPLGLSPSASQLVACGHPPAVAGASDATASTSTGSTSTDTSSESSSTTAESSTTGAPTDTSTATSSTDTGTTTSSSDTNSTDPLGGLLGSPSPSPAFRAAAVRQANPGRFTQNLTQEGSIGSIWTYKLSFSPQGDGLGIKISIKPQTIGGEINVTGALSGFRTKGSVHIDGCEKNFKFSADNLTSDLTVAWDLTNAKHVFASNLLEHPTLKMLVPIGNVGGVPLQAVVGTGLDLLPAFSTTGDHSVGTVHSEFRGRAGFQVSNGSAKAEPGMSINVSAPNAATLSTGGGGGGYVAATTFGLGLGDARTMSQLGSISMVTSGSNVAEGTLGLAARHCSMASGTVNAALDDAAGHTSVPVSRTTVATKTLTDGSCK